MSHEKVLVTGATGKLGRELVPLLLEAGVEVTAGTRDPERGRALFGSGVEVRELNYARTETYDAALMWADRVFLMPPPFSPDAYEAIGAFLDWAVAARVEHVVLLSGMAMPEESDLPLRRAELHLEGQDVAGTIIRPNLYMQNLYPGFIYRQIRQDGEIRLPAGQEGVSLVDVRDVAAVAARALTESGWAGRSVTLTGPRALDMHEVSRILSRHTGRPVAYEPIEDQEFQDLLEADGWRAGEIEVILGLFRSVREGWRKPVLADLEEALDRPPRSFEAFAAELEGVWE